MEYRRLKRVVCEQCEAFGAGVMLIEDKASGPELIQELCRARPARASPATGRGRTRSCALGDAEGAGRRSNGRPQ
jgi:hypothetical protein